VIGLGEHGPKLTVAATAEGLAATVPEHPAITVPEPGPGRPAESRAYGLTLRAAGTGKRYEARGVGIRIGRGRECEIQVAATDDTTVSRVHAELTVGPSGGLVVRDAGSKNGTLVNGELVGAPVLVRLGDKIQLGKGGPVLLVEGLGTAPVHGEVVSIHRAGLKEAPGFALSVPIKHAIALFPQDLKDRFGLK
jgi:pSer/pThr/pTyr-binding forkhead associated (FHA) protein